jgi:hypothetical protein
MAQYLDAQGNVVEEDRMAKLYLDPETGDDVTGRQLLHRKKVIAQAEENARALGEKPQNFLQASRMVGQEERDLFGVAAAPLQIAKEIGTGGLGYATAFADMMLGAAQEVPHIQHRVSTRLSSALGRTLTDDEEAKARISQREKDVLEASTYHSKEALKNRENRAHMLTTPVTGPGKLRSVAHMAGGVAPVVAGTIAAPEAMIPGLALSMLGRAGGDVAATPIAEILGEEEEVVRSVTGPAGEIIGFVGGMKGGKTYLPQVKATLRNWREARAVPRNTASAATGAPDPAVEPPFPSIESAMARIEVLAKASETTPQEAAAAIDRATGGAGTGKPKSGKVSTDLTGLPGTAASVTAKLMVYRAFDSLFPGMGILAKFFSGSLAAKKAPGFVGKALAGIKGKLGLGEVSPDISSLKPKQVQALVAELNKIIGEMEKAQDAIATQMSEGRSLTPVAGEELLDVAPKPTSTTLPEEVLGALRDPATTPLDPRSANLPGGRAHKVGSSGEQPFMRPGHPADIIVDANLSQTTPRTARRPPEFIEEVPEGGPAGAPSAGGTGKTAGFSPEEVTLFNEIMTDLTGRKGKANFPTEIAEQMARAEIIRKRGPGGASEAPPAEPAPKGPAPEGPTPTEPVPQGAVDSRGIAIVEAAKFPERKNPKPATPKHAPKAEPVAVGERFELEGIGEATVAQRPSGKLVLERPDGSWVDSPLSPEKFYRDIANGLKDGTTRRLSEGAPPVPPAPTEGGPEPRRPMQPSAKEQGIRDEIDLIDQRVAASDRRQSERPSVERPEERRVGPRRETEEPVAPAREPGQAALPLEGQTELTGMPEIAKGRQTAAEAGLTVTEAPAGKNKTLWETRNKNGHVIDVTTTEAEAYSKIGRGETDLPIAPRESPPEGFTGPAGEAIADAHGLLAPKTTPAPTEPPAKPAGPSRSTERVFETKSGEPFEKTPLDSEARLTAFERPGGPTDAEWVRMYGTMATKAKRAWLEEAGRIGEKEPLIIDPDGTMRDGEGNIIQPGAPSEVPPQTPPVKPGKQKTAAVGTSAKPGPPPTPPAEVEAALKASIEKPPVKPPKAEKPAAPTKGTAATLKARGWSVKKEGDTYSIYNKRGKKIGSKPTKAEAMKEALRRSKERGAKAAPKALGPELLEHMLKENDGKVTGEIRSKFTLPLAVKTPKQARAYVKQNLGAGTKSAPKTEPIADKDLPDATKLMRPPSEEGVAAIKAKTKGSAHAVGDEVIVSHLKSGGPKTGNVTRVYTDANGKIRYKVKIKDGKIVDSPELRLSKIKAKPKPGRVPVSQSELERARGILAKKKPAPKVEPKVVADEDVRPMTGKGHKVGDVVKNSRGARKIVEEVDSEGRIDIVRNPRKKTHGMVVKDGKVQVEPGAEGLITQGLKDSPNVRKGSEASKRPIYVTKKRQAKNVRAERNLDEGKDLRGGALKKPAEPASKPFKDSDGNTWGPRTFKQWLSRARRHLGEGSAEWRSARNWYREMKKALETEYPDLNERQISIIAFAATQKAASPSTGLVSLNRALDIVAGAKGRLKPGMSEKALSEALGGKDTITGFGQKLSDFADSFFGLKIRSWTGRAGKYKPAAIDRHALVDVGFVTEAMKNDMIAQGVKGFKQDVRASTGSDGQYHFALRYYNKLAEWMNKNNIDGGGWTPAEVQAIGWTATRKALGKTPESAATAFNNNTRIVSAEVTGFAPRSDLGKFVMKRGGLTLKESVEVHKKLASDLITRAAKIAGVQIRKMVVDRGAWMDDRNAGTYSKILGSPEAVAEFAAILGKAARQTAVPFFRRVKSGGSPGFVFESSKKLSADQAAAVWDLAVSLEETGSLGQSWLRSLGYSRDGNMMITAKYYEFTPAQWTKAQASLYKYLPQALKKLYKAEGTGTAARLDAHYVENDWANGSAYWDSVLENARPGTRKSVQRLSSWYAKQFKQALADVKGYQRKPAEAP